MKLFKDVPTPHQFRLIKAKIDYINIIDVFLPPANEVLGKVIFSEACVKNSVHKGRGLPQCMLGYQPIPPPMQTPPPGQGPHKSRHPPRSRHPPGADPLEANTSPSRPLPPGAVHAGRYGQQAGGTHPTGMHSCVRFFILANSLLTLPGSDSKPDRYIVLCRTYSQWTE